MDISLWRVESSNYYVAITETLRCRDFIRNMMTGTARADYTALILLLLLTYKEIVQEVNTYTKQTGYNPDPVSFVPISGWNGRRQMLTWFSQGLEITWKDGGSCVHIKLPD
ncbi:Elongation factor 1-alpha 1, partial [Galemys pyrenaicus]